MHPPRVSVLTATYNGARFLAASITSILGQSFTDFEYIIVDDASSDTSPAIVAGFAARDSRIRLLRNATNLGPAGALNQGLAQARGDYVAVLDHDDLAMPERLARQVTFLDDHPVVGAVGAQVRLYRVDDTPTPRQLVFPRDPIEARWQILFGASLLHSAAMYRRQRLLQVGGYSAQHPSLCDYELLLKLAEVCQLANLDDELAGYRRSDGQYSAIHRPQQFGQMLLLQYAWQQRWLGLRPDLGVWSQLCRWQHGTLPATEVEARAAIEYLHTLLQRYLETRPAEEHGLLQQAGARRWLLLAHHAYARLPLASRACWQHALQLDPLLLRRAQSWAMLRRQRRLTASRL